SPVYVPFEPPHDVSAAAVSSRQVVVRWQEGVPREPRQIYTVRTWAPDGTDLNNPWSTGGTEVTTGLWDPGSTLVVRVASCGIYSGRCGPWIPESGVAVTLPAEVATLSGLVTAPDGSPLAGASVWAYASGDTWLPSATTTTAADGSYALVDIPSSD